MEPLENIIERENIYNKDLINIVKLIINAYLNKDYNVVKWLYQQHKYQYNEIFIKLLVIITETRQDESRKGPDHVDFRIYDDKVYTDTGLFELLTMGQHDGFEIPLNEYKKLMVENPRDYPPLNEYDLYVKSASSSKNIRDLPTSTMSSTSSLPVPDMSRISDFNKAGSYTIDDLRLFLIQYGVSFKSSDRKPLLAEKLRDRLKRL